MKEQHVIADQMAEIRLSYKPLRKPHTPVIKTSEESYRQAIKYFPSDTIALQEHFIVLFLNRSNYLIGGCLLSSGGISGTIADLRIILGIALKSVASAIVVVHNHPSGNKFPSASDKDLTQKLKSAAALMDIQLLDHLIVSPTEGEYYSFADEGIL